MADALQHPDDDCVFSVVGEHREDPNLILLCGEDGTFYRLDPSEGVPVPVEIGAEWRLDRRAFLSNQTGSAPARPQRLPGQPGAAGGAQPRADAPC